MLNSLLWLRFMSRKSVQAFVCVLLVALLTLLCITSAQAASPLLKLLQSGKVPAERKPTVVEMVCKRGDADDLSYVFAQVLDPAAFAPELRLKALSWLTDAAKINKIKPTGDLAKIEQLLGEGEAARNPQFALAVMQLAAQWHVASISDELQKIATADKADEKLQAAAIDGQATIGDATSRAAIAQLAGPGHPTRIRYAAVAALAGLDLDAAAKAAAALLAQSQPGDDPTALIQAFLDRKQGPEKLATAVTDARLSADVAKLALRTMYAAGRSDAVLSDVLSKAAGIAVDAPPPTGAELTRLIDLVTKKGDADRGERVFRRTEVAA